MGKFEIGAVLDVSIVQVRLLGERTDVRRLERSWDNACQQRRAE